MILLASSICFKMFSSKPVVPITNAVFVLIATSMLLKVDSGVVKSIIQSDTEKISSLLSVTTRLESKLNIIEKFSPT